MNTRLAAVAPSLDAYFALLTGAGESAVNVPVWVVEFNGLDDLVSDPRPLPLGASPRPTIAMHHVVWVLKDSDLSSEFSLECP